MLCREKLILIHAWPKLHPIKKGKEKGHFMLQ